MEIIERERTQGNVAEERLAFPLDQLVFFYRVIRAFIRPHRR
jgi:hypothetical protein